MYKNVWWVCLVGLLLLEICLKVSVSVGVHQESWNHTDYLAERIWYRELTTQVLGLKKTKGTPELNRNSNCGKYLPPQRGWIYRTWKLGGGVLLWTLSGSSEPSWHLRSSESGSWGAGTHILRYRYHWPWVGIRRLVLGVWKEPGSWNLLLLPGWRVVFRWLWLEQWTKLGRRKPLLPSSCFL